MGAKNRFVIHKSQIIHSYSANTAFFTIYLQFFVVDTEYIFKHIIKELLLLTNFAIANLEQVLLQDANYV